MRSAGQTVGAKIHLAKWHARLFWIPLCLFTAEAAVVQGELEDLTTPQRYIPVSRGLEEYHERIPLQTPTESRVDLQGMGMKRQTVML